MTKPKYLYIDDEFGTSEEFAIHVFNDYGLIEVELFNLNEFKDFGKLRNELKERRNKSLFDGLIIDLRLDGGGDNTVDFNATSLAQELRSVAARGEMKAFPIILCSTEPKIRETYDADKSSHDLFDYKFEKSINPDSKKFSKKLFALAEGYSWLNQTSPQIKEIIGRDEIESLDPRIFENLIGASKNVVYDYASFIVKDLFHGTNPLLKDRIVAARLGIDMELSGENFELLMNNHFQPALYCGVFREGWNRWWADKILDIANDIIGKRLSFLKAKDRVNILIEKTGIKGLVAAEPLKFCQSTEFWTICEAYKKPLDPLEGFRIYSSSDLKVWQESKYLSLNAILERIGIDKGLRPHPSEKQRIEDFKEIVLKQNS